MHEILGGGDLVDVTAKAALLYVTAVVGFRVAARRTLAEMNAFDFVAAVAVGAIVGRVPNASGTGYLEGLATLITILVLHAVLTRLRRVPGASTLIDHPPRLLVVHGEIQERQLRRGGLTHADLDGLLRRSGVHDLAEVKYAVFESRGTISIIREDGELDANGDLFRDLRRRDEWPAH